MRRGHLEARIWIPAFSYIAAAVLLIPGLVSSHLTPALWFDVAGATFLSAANPPLDAARLDIMPAGLWGRAESTRTVLRSLAQAAAPLVFGGLADLIAGIVPEQAPIGTHPGVVTPSAARGLEISFLLLLGTLVAAGLFLLKARATYPRDVATAAASHQGTARGARAMTCRGVDGGPRAVVRGRCDRGAARPTGTIARWVSRAVARCSTALTQHRRRIDRAA